MWEGYEWGEGRPDKILLSQVRTGTRGQLSFLRPFLKIEMLLLLTNY